MIEEDSAKELAKSQLYTAKGEPVDQTLKVGDEILSQKTDSRRLNDIIIDQKYKIIGLLGEGGMGAVYEARQLTLNNRKVALKTFKSSRLSDDSWKRFQREAQAIARLDHVNIVQVLDFGVGEDNIPYYTMECLSGESLADRLAARGPLALDQTVQIFLQVCRGMSAAHNKGIIHRDLKPANIFLTKSTLPGGQGELVKIVDFGIADLATGSSETQKLTTAGTIFGSPLYMSPEQSLGKRVTERSDIYSCGCALFETLTGSPPFRGTNAFATMAMHQQSPAPRLSDMPGQRKLSQRMIALVASMLAKEEGDRLQSFDDISAELEEITRTISLPRPTGKGNSADAQVTERSPAKDGLTRDTTSKMKKVMIAGASILLVITAGALVLFLPDIRQFRKEPSPVASVKPLPLSQPKARKEESEAPAQQPFPKPYLQNPGENFAKVPRKFLFPYDQTFGELKWYPRDGNTIAGLQAGEHPASGLVIVPAQTDLRFDPDQAFLKNPQLFKGFGANDLKRLVFQSNLEEPHWGDKHLACMTHLTGLIRLEIGGTSVTGACIGSLNKLKSLRILGVDNTSLTGKDLIKLESLTKLTDLCASDNDFFSIVLQKLEKSNRLRALQAKSCHLKDSDMDAIGHLSSLAVLKISGNPDISDKGIESISHLQKLQELDLSGTRVSVACSNYLQRLPVLNDLTIDEKNKTNEDIARIEAALPNCHVHVNEVTDAIFAH